MASGCENYGEQMQIFSKQNTDQIPTFFSQNDNLNFNPLKNLDEQIDDQIGIFQNKANKNKEKIFLNILQQVQFTQKNGNAPRKLMEILLEKFPKFLKAYTQQQRKKIIQTCKNQRKWHLQSKKNVYKLDHIQKFFVTIEHDFPETEKKNREIFNMILRKFSLSSLKNPRSQIEQNKTNYLRVMKIFALRCRNKKLIERNQAR